MKIIESILTKNPCYTAGRKITVQGLMLHSVGCSQPSAQVFVNSWNKSSFSGACVHGFIDANTGDVYQTLPWDHRGWHCGGSGNNTHIGVEMCEPACIKYTGGSSFTCSDLTTAKKCAERTYNSAVELFAMLCEKFGLDPMKDIVSHKEGHSLGIATNHSDPEHLWKGLGMDYTMDTFRTAVKAKMKGSDPIPAPVATGLQASEFQGLSTTDLITKVGSLFTADQKKSGVLASVSFAQFILESGWGKSELAQNANNCFGMKKSLSGNTWSGSVWDGTSIYTKQTKEWTGDGYITKSAEFRKYPCVEDSIADHSAYLLGALKGSDLRYAGLKGETNYKTAITIIKNGGYATSPTYIDKICELIEQYGLTKYDAQDEPKVEEKIREIHVFYPSWNRSGYPDDRRGAGVVWHDQDGNTLVVDNYDKNSVPSGAVIDYLVKSNLTTIDFVGTHAHSDHLGGGFQILNDSRIKVRNVYVYDPATLKLAGSGSANARSVKSDKAYLQKFIDLAKSKGATVHYVGNGSVIVCGDMQFAVYRDQPTSFTSYDGGYGWAYLNDGSLCLYSKQAYFMMAGDADASEFVKDYNLTVKICEVGHHGNNGNKTSAKIYDQHGCVLGIQCNHEAKLGGCDFTRYGTGRMIEQGIPVWQLDANIYGTIKAGVAVFTQGSKTKSWSCPFGTGDSSENDLIPHYYRVRKSWSDSKSQVGAYAIYNNAVIKANEMGSAYAVFDWNGKEVYRQTTTTTTTTTTEFPTTPFLVKISGSDMNIRKGAGTEYPAKMKCPIGIYTIVQVSGEWGRLKSGAGWVWLNDPLCSIMGTVDKVQTVQQVDITKLAREVISGKWGNGSARKKALTEAGYDYNAVQKKVNELLS